MWGCKNKKQMDNVGFFCWTRKRIALSCWKIVAWQKAIMMQKKKKTNHVCDGDEVKHEHY